MNSVRILRVVRHLGGVVEDMVIVETDGGPVGDERQWWRRVRWGHGGMIGKGSLEEFE